MTGKKTMLLYTTETIFLKHTTFKTYFYELYTGLDESAKCDILTM